MEKTIYQTDHEWLTQQDDGSYHLEIADEIDDRGEDEPRFAVFGVDLERFAEVKVDSGKKYIVTRYIADGYRDGTLPHPISSYDEWFAKDLARVAESAGTTERALRKQLCSADPKQRAAAYVDIAGYHGWENFDSYPQELTETELDARWSKREGAGKGRRRRGRAALVAASHQHHQRMDRATRPTRPVRVDALAAAVAKLTR